MDNDTKASIRLGCAALVRIADILTRWETDRIFPRFVVEAGPLSPATNISGVGGAPQMYGPIGLSGQPLDPGRGNVGATVNLSPDAMFVNPLTGEAAPGVIGAKIPGMEDRNAVDEPRCAAPHSEGTGREVEAPMVPRREFDATAREERGSGDSGGERGRQPERPEV